MNPTPRSSSSARTAWVVSLESKISSLGVVAGGGLPVAGKRDDLAVLAGVGHVCLAVKEGVAVRVLGEERQH
jgi:hypothetical protein